MNSIIDKQRISSIDLMRGLVMIVMALDHTRDFFHADALLFNPTDLTKTTPLLFFTRWITHFCAPTFVLLSGTSMRLSLQRKSKIDLSVFLLTRGLWLIFLEVVVIRFSFFFNFYYDATVFQVIWVIGAAMVAMAAIIFLQARVVLILGLILVFGHNVLDGIQLENQNSFYAMWVILHQTGPISISSEHLLLVMYPLLPWLGIMMLGYSLGSWYTNEIKAEQRQVLLFRTGLAAIILFFVLRLINIYGDPDLWSTQDNFIFTLMDFLNCTKYPPSLMYCLMTLGPVLMILSWMEKRSLKTLSPIVVFGRVPLFYYIIHFYLIHATALILYMIDHNKSFDEIDFHFANSFGGISSGAGVSLPWVYVVWISIVLILYPLCAWYNKYKSTHKQWWLSYL